jgi:nicotinate phosphoribosyltransferase
MESFEIYYDYYEEDTILLIDTYDIGRGAEKASKFGNNILGVRIDSGNLAEEAKRVRKILNENGAEEVSIVLSSNLDEYKIKEILDSGAPVRALGIGTELVTSSDSPKLGAVYKLMENNGEPKIKISEGKVTYPSSKQVYRFFDNNGKFKKDILALEKEKPPERGEPLLIPIMKKGELVYELAKIEKIREFSLENVKKLPDEFKSLEKRKFNELTISNEIKRLWDDLVERYQ